MQSEEQEALNEQQRARFAAMSPEQQRAPYAAISPKQQAAYIKQQRARCAAMAKTCSKYFPRLLPAAHASAASGLPTATRVQEPDHTGLIIYGLYSGPWGTGSYVWFYMQVIGAQQVIHSFIFRSLGHRK